MWCVIQIVGSGIQSTSALSCVEKATKRGETDCAVMSDFIDVLTEGSLLKFPGTGLVGRSGRTLGSRTLGDLKIRMSQKY